MKIQNKSRLGIALFTLSVVSLIGVAFSTWVVVEGNFDSMNNTVDVEQGTVNATISGIEIKNNTEFKVGRYFYYVDNQHSSKIDLIYTFNITPSSLNNSFKNASGSGYTFNLNADLSIKDFTSPVFGNNTNLETIAFNNQTINDPIWNFSSVSFVLNFQTATTSDIVESFELKFTFNNNLILSYRDQILGKKFLLQVSSGDIQ